MCAGVGSTNPRTGPTSLRYTPLLNFSTIGEFEYFELLSSLTSDLFVCTFKAFFEAVKAAYKDLRCLLANRITFQLPYRTRDAGVIRQVAYFGLKWFLCLQVDTSSWKLTECLPQLWCPLHLYIYNSTHSIYTLDTNHFSSSVFLCKTYLKRWQCLWNNLSLWTLKCIFVTRIDSRSTHDMDKWTLKATYFSVHEIYEMICQSPVPPRISCVIVISSLNIFEAWPAEDRTPEPGWCADDAAVLRQDT